MNPIDNNPFRVLGLSLTATEREIAKQVDTLLIYAEMGKNKPLATDFPFLPLTDRTPQKIEEAIKQIEQNDSRLLYSFFWFWKNNSADELAFEVLKEGNIEKAISIWEKLAFSNKVKVYEPIPIYEDLIQQSTGWSTQKDEDHCLSKNEHEYLIERKKTTSSSIPVVQADINYSENWTIEVDTEWRGGVDNIGYGIIIGRDKGSYFKFDIAANGYYCFSKNVDWSFNKIIPWKQCESVKKWSQNRLMVKKIDAELHFYINGEYVDSIASELFFGKYFGFSVSNNQTVSFKHFKFCRLVEDKTYGEGISISLTNISNVKNLSTLFLALSLDSNRGEFKISNFNKAIALAKSIFNSQSIDEYSKLIAGEIYNFSKAKVLVFYIDGIIDAIKPFLNEPGGISINNFVRMFAHFPIEAKQYLHNRFFSKELMNIDRAIEMAKATRRESGRKGLDAGKVLIKSTETDFEYLKNSLGSLDYNFRTISDKLSAEIVQCGIDAFNSWKTPAGEVDFPKAIISEENYLHEYQYALSIAMSESVREKALENIESCTRMIADKPYYVCWFCGTNLPSELNKFEITIYKVTHRSYFPRQVQFQYVPVTIQRCNECQMIHEKTSGRFMMSLVGLSAVGLIIGIIADGNWFAGLLIGGIVGLILGTVLKESQTSKTNTKQTTHSSIREYPPLKEMLSQGWQFTKPSA